MPQAPDMLSQALEALREGSEHQIWSDESLLRVLDALPKDTGLRSIDDLEALLLDFGNFVNGSPDAEDDLAAAFLSFAQPRLYVVAIPLARAEADLPKTLLGGRDTLSLQTEAMEGGKFVTLAGVAKEGHWAIAKRTAVALAEEVTGLLHALGLVTHSRTWWPGPGAGPQAVFIAEPGGTEPGDTQQELTVWAHNHAYLTAREQHDIWSTRFETPLDLTDLERSEQASRGLVGVFERRLGLLARVIQTGGPEGKRIRRAARFLRKASVVDEPGDAFLFMATCLEGLLIDSQENANLASRVSEAVGFIVGETQEQRRSARELAKYLYNVRSRYIHDGEYIGTDRKRLECIDLTRAVVAHETRIG